MRPRDVRGLVKDGSSSIPRLQELLKHSDVEVRREAVKAIVEIGTRHSLEPLIAATADHDAEVQIRATDGLVNFYYPDYVRTGLSGTLRRVGTSIKGRFTDTNDQVIEPYVEVNPDVLGALGKLARGGVNMDVRANAARAIGVLRGREATPDLLEALKSKDTAVIYESLVAFQKMRDQSVGPKIAFLLRDPEPKVQTAAAETIGLLQYREAIPDLVNLVNRSRDRTVRRAALTSLAMLPDESNRPLFERHLSDGDERMRGAAAEGLGRLKREADVARLTAAFQEERKMPARLSLAFALVTLGRNDWQQYSPLQYLVETLNSSSWRGEAYGFLVELARDAAVRQNLYRPLTEGTKDERIWLARVMARSGDKAVLEHLEYLSRDRDPDVAQEGLRAVRTLKARL